MHKYSFTFGTTDLFTAYGLRIRQKHGILKPTLRARKLTIPARSGAYDFGAKYYDERTISVECDTVRNLSAADRRELAYLLSGKDKLRFWDEPDKYYVGRIYDAAEIEKVGGIGSYFPLVFVCEPFAYGETVSVTKNDGETQIVPNYAGTAETPTRIEIVNNSTSDFTGIQITIRKRRA